ncbi:UNVERIFIED_CONTAM: hypothetical protein FKN15_071845 [Acipenser sinensis]
MNVLKGSFGATTTRAVSTFQAGTIVSAEAVSMTTAPTLLMGGLALDGKIFCRRTACDCLNPNVDLFCCPECDSRVTSQCFHQSGHKVYRSGDNWTYSCQHCRCLEGEVDCWPLACPVVDCEYTAVSEGECCPRCVSDPCLADNIAYDIRKTCLENYGIIRLSGSIWTMAGSPCTTCKCKVHSNNMCVCVCVYIYIYIHIVPFDSSIGCVCVLITFASKPRLEMS